MFTVLTVAQISGPAKPIWSSQKFKSVPCHFKSSFMRFEFLKNIFGDCNPTCKINIWPTLMGAGQMSMWHCSNACIALFQHTQMLWKCSLVLCPVLKHWSCAFVPCGPTLCSAITPLLSDPPVPPRKVCSPVSGKQHKLESCEKSAWPNLNDFVFLLSTSGGTWFQCVALCAKAKHSCCRMWKKATGAEACNDWSGKKLVALVGTPNWHQPLIPVQNIFVTQWMV